MTQRVSVLVFALLSAYISKAEGLYDSTKSNSDQKVVVKLTPRLQSLGFFAYGGQIGCDNPTFDFNYTIEKKNWGYFLFKSFDLQNLHSHNNFALTMVYRYLHLNKRLTITPYVGFFIPQGEAIIGSESDISFVLTTTIKASKNLTLDNTALVPHLMFHRNSMDWVNRFRIIYTYQHFDFTMYTWHNNNIFDQTAYYSSGVSAFYNRVKISDSVQMNTGITQLWMIDTSNEEDAPRKNGLLISVLITFRK